MSAIDYSKWIDPVEWDFRAAKEDITNATYWEYIRASEQLLEAAGRNRTLRTFDFSTPWSRLEKKPVFVHHRGQPFKVWTPSEIEAEFFEFSEMVDFYRAPRFVIDVDLTADANKTLIPAFRKWLRSQRAIQGKNKDRDKAARLKWLEAWKLAKAGVGFESAQREVGALLGKRPIEMGDDSLVPVYSESGWIGAIKDAEKHFAEMVTKSASW